MVRSVGKTVNRFSSIVQKLWKILKKMINLNTVNYILLFPFVYYIILC